MNLGINLAVIERMDLYQCLTAHDPLADLIGFSHVLQNTTYGFVVHYLDHSAPVDREDNVAW